jgi:hypothetical protein
VDSNHPAQKNFNSIQGFALFAIAQTVLGVALGSFFSFSSSTTSNCLHKAKVPHKKEEDEQREQWIGNACAARNPFQARLWVLHKTRIA